MFDESVWRKSDGVLVTSRTDRPDECRKLVTNPATAGEVTVYVQSFGLKVVTRRVCSVLLTPRPPVWIFFGRGGQ